MNREEAIVWCEKQLGKALDYDGVYGAQCVDFFNYYVQKVTGENPYELGLGVASAYQLYNAAPSEFFEKKMTGVPKPGDIMIYQRIMPGSDGHGHVAIVASATEDTIVVYEQNWGGMYVQKHARKRSYERGYLIVKEFKEEFMGRTSLSNERMLRFQSRGQYDALAGKQDAELKKKAGRDGVEAIEKSWLAPEAVKWREKKLPKLMADAAKVPILEKQIIQLKAQQGNDTEANILGKALIKLLASLGYKKG